MKSLFALYVGIQAQRSPIGPRLGDAVILKSIIPPSLAEFSGLMQEASQSVKMQGLKVSDVSKMIRAIIDTNVFISGTMWKCTPHKILEHWSASKFKLVVSGEIANEYELVSEKVFDFKIINPRRFSVKNI